MNRITALKSTLDRVNKVLFRRSISCRHCRALHRGLYTKFRAFFPPSHSTRTKRAPQHGTPRREPSPGEKVGIFDEGCETSSRLPLLQLLLSTFSRKGRRKIERNLSPTHTPPSPIPPAHHLTVIISICYLTPCLIYVASSFPVVAYFLPL